MTTPDFRRRVLSIVAYLLVVAAVLGFVLWEHQRRQRIIEALEPTARSAVFESTVQSFERFCLGHGGKDFASYCAEQRELLKLFPECHQGCRELLAKSEPGPTR